MHFKMSSAKCPIYIYRHRYYMCIWYILLTFPWYRLQMETVSHYWPFVRGIHRSPVEWPVSTHKRQWRGALLFSLIYAWTNDWANKRRRWFETPLRSLWRHCNNSACLRPSLCNKFTGKLNSTPPWCKWWRNCGQFRSWKSSVSNFFIGVCSLECDLWENIIDLDNGSAPNRRQAII